MSVCPSLARAEIVTAPICSSDTVAPVTAPAIVGETVTSVTSVVRGRQSVARHEPDRRAALEPADHDEPLSGCGGVTISAAADQCDEGDEQGDSANVE